MFMVSVVYDEVVFCYAVVPCCIVVKMCDHS
jgi:hypothetical protein